MKLFSFILLPLSTYVDSNNIKFLNGESFIRLKNLEKVWLNDNVCIDDYFIGESRVSDMFEIVTEKCGMCGKVIVGSGRIVRGRASERGTWPFATALYHVTDEVFFCGGSLISNQHVLTGTVKYFIPYDFIFLKQILNEV